MQSAAFPQCEPPDEVGKENLSSLFHVQEIPQRSLNDFWLNLCLIHTVVAQKSFAFYNR